VGRTENPRPRQASGREMYQAERPHLRPLCPCVAFSTSAEHPHVWDDTTSRFDQLLVRASPRRIGTQVLARLMQRCLRSVT